MSYRLLPWFTRDEYISLGFLDTEIIIKNLYFFFRGSVERLDLSDVSQPYPYFLRLGQPRGGYKRWVLGNHVHLS